MNSPNDSLLRLVGGMLLVSVWIAITLVSHTDGATLRQAVGIVILAVVVMSLDCMIAGAARDEMVRGWWYARGMEHAKDAGDASS